MDERAGRTWRHNIIFAFLMLAVVGLCVRMGLLLRDGRAEAVELAQRQQRMEIPLPARTGSIFARSSKRYLPLAISRQKPSCYVDPFLLRDEEIADVSIALAGALNLDARDVQHKILTRRKRRFAWIKRRIGPSEVSAVRKAKLPGVGIIFEWQREYPNGSLAASVVGFRRKYGEAGGGAELSQDERLKARDGKRVVLADAKRNPIWPLPKQSRLPRDGDSVFLTIDLAIQESLERAVAESVSKFGAKWGTGVVVDPRNGKVLAMCSFPTFDPNTFNTAPAANRTNRAISYPYEPGSIAKPLFAAGAVNEGLMTFDTEIFCENGTYRAYRGGRISDPGHSYGNLSLTDIVVKSSNIGMAKVGEKLGNARLHAIAKRFGLGEKTGIELPGESAGIIRPLRRWDTYSLRRIPFGQEMSATTLQMVMAFCAIANGGELLQARLIEKVTDADGRLLWQGRRRLVRRVLRAKVAYETLAVMREVVERGTGKACRLSRWTSFGKTGTAQIPGPGGYVEDAYTGSFVGGAPASNPQLVCLISIYRPEKSKGYYGAKVAAPFVREVLEEALMYRDVPGDLPGGGY